MANKEVQFKDGNDNIFPKIANRRINSNTNLDNCMEPGTWNCWTSTDAGTLTNSPITNAGFPMEVFLVGDGNARMQVIYSGQTIYVRRRTSTAWGSWYKYTGTQI